MSWGRPAGALLLATGLTVPVAGAQSPGGNPADAGEERLEAIEAVSAALLLEENISPELKHALLDLMAVLKREERSRGPPEADILATLDRLTVRSDEHERIITPWSEIADRLHIFGDLRLRHETDTSRDDRSSRNRERTRLRVGAHFDATDELGVGARLVTGDPDDPNGSHVTLGDVFDGEELSFDRAFAVYEPSGLPGFWLRAGKFGHPFRSNPVYGELVWDDDVQPEGVAAGYTLQDVVGLDRVRIVAGEYLVLEQNDGDEASAFVAQVSGRTAVSPTWDVDAAVGYYRYSHLSADGSLAVAADNAGNALGADGSFLSRFAILHPVLAATYSGGDEPLTISAEAIDNRRAATGTGHGWGIGVAWGDNRSEGDSRVYYQYQDIEQDAVLAPFAQDDFLLSTGFRGHAAGWQYQLRDSARLHIWSLVAQRKPGLSSDPTAERNDQWRLRLDLDVKF